MPISLTNFSNWLTVQNLVLAIAVVAFLVIIDAFWLFFLTRKLRRLLGGSQAKDIYESQVLIRQELEDLKKFRTELELYLEGVESRLRRSIQSVETVRFNPFKGTGDGGNQSFSTAFISEKGDGVVVSGLYSRERVSVFSKPVHNFASEIALTEEEQEVVKNSRKKVSGKSSGKIQPTSQQ